MRWTLLIVILAKMPASIAVAQSWADYANKELDMHQRREVEKQARLADDKTVWDYLKWLNVDMETGAEIAKRAKAAGISVFEYIKIREGEYSLVDPISPQDAAAYARDLSGLSANQFAKIAQDVKADSAARFAAPQQQSISESLGKATVWPDGRIIRNDGSYGGFVYPDGRVISADGNFRGSVVKDGRIIESNGDYGGFVYPDGRVIGADGNYKGSLR